jgi:hypothetical protein
MHEFNSLSWDVLLSEAQAENDAAKLIPKIFELEAALTRRLQELRYSDDGQRETDAIWTACQELRKLKTERLKWSRDRAGWRQAS